MSITTFFELKEAIGNWMNKRSALAERIPEFIVLAEARFRRKLDDVEQQTIATGALSSGAVALPTDCGAVIALRDTTSGGNKLEQVSISQFEAYAVSSGNPVVYTIIGDQIKTMPTSGNTLEIVYKLGLPALSDAAPTNWLLSRAPDAYLFGSLVQAEFFGWNDERLPLIKSALDEIMNELTVDSERRSFGPAPLMPRIGRP